MYFFKEPKEENNADGKKYSVYMDLGRKVHYVCDMADDDCEKSSDINHIGLTLRARLLRSKGAYAMLEGEIFNPDRLLSAACNITAYTAAPFIGGVYKDGYTLLTVTADGCTNKYLIFSEQKLNELVASIKNQLD